MNKKILLLDNFDSFTYNIFHILQSIKGVSTSVFRNDSIKGEEVLKFDGLVFSPGPGLPKDGGIMPELIDRFKETKPMLGICLGHQALVEAFGGRLENLGAPMHGIANEIKVLKREDSLFFNLPERFQAMHYHSWVASRYHFPSELEITAEDELGNLMGMAHRKFPLKGIQFHPESVLTPHGSQMIKNWIYF